MRGSKTKWLAMATLAALAAGLSCTGNDLDDAGAADVILEVIDLQAPPITAQRSTATDGQCSVSAIACQSNADCPITEACVRQEVCTLEVTEWTADLRNQPKNTLGVGVYNDIVLLNVVINYAWLDPTIVTADRTVGLGNIIVPAEQTASVTFFPIASDDVNANADIEGSTANLTLTINARTIEGTSIRQSVQRQLQVEVCN